MSFHLDQLLGAERQAACAANDLRTLGEVEPIRCSLPASNDEPAAFIRQPELDKRVERGDMVNGNAWFEVATGKTRLYFCGFDPNVGRWMPLGMKL